MSRSLDRRTALKGALGATLLSAGFSRDTLAFQATPDASPIATGDARVIAAANGDITIAGTPSRVIAMEYELVENLVVLGVEPVGVCERDSINQWVPLPEPLPETITDTGTRDEPDIETIISLEPDLILAASPRQDEVLDTLEGIAPTVQLATYSPFAAPEGLSPIEHFQQVLSQVAQATNQEAAAETAIADFDDLLAAGAAAIAATEFAGRNFVFAGSFDDNTAANLFNTRSRIGYTIEQLGLVNQAGENSETPGLHYETLAIEQLGTLPADTLFFVSVSPEIEAESTSLFQSEIWQAMPFVQAGGFVNLGEPNIWTAGSAITLSNLIERVVAALGGTIAA